MKIKGFAYGKNLHVWEKAVLLSSNILFLHHHLSAGTAWVQW